jgi:hypothetical protein
LELVQRLRIREDQSCILSYCYPTRVDSILILGALAPLASITLVRTVSFSIYQNAKYKYSAAIGRLSGNEEPLVVVNRPGSIPTFGTVICFSAAGATAGGIITAIACKRPFLPTAAQFHVESYNVIGPFELTKLSAQISVLMARSNKSGVDDRVRRSYQQKGTFRTAKNIVLHRGLGGLYSGFSYHLCELNTTWEF